MNLMLIWLSLLVVTALPTDPLAGLLSKGPLARCTVAMAVADATTGERLYDRLSDLPLTPASNMKLVTTAAAVMRLGARFQFTTRLLASSAPDEQGVVSGDLIVVGSGDPCLRMDALAPEGIADPAGFLVDLLLSTGVRRIDGQLVLDDGLLDRQGLHSDWLAEDLDHSYAAPVSALSIGGNCLSVSVDGTQDDVRPGMRLELLSDGYEVRNEMRWASRSNQADVMVLRPDSGGVVRVSGRLSRGLATRSYTVPVRDGALLFGRRMLAQLRARSITVSGGLAREGGAAQRRAGAVELVRFETPLSLAVLLANKESDNSISDHLFKLLGAHGEGAGSFAGGAAAVRRFLEETVGTAGGGLMLQDGSGLADSNRLTASSLVDVLVCMNAAPSPERSVFLASLPVAGRDGSLASRLTDPPYRGAVRAKTGHISGASALSGYAVAQSGRVVAFSILANGLKPGDNAQIKAIQDDLCRQLIELW